MRTRKCFFTDRNNYFVVELPAALPAGFEYWIFFDVRGVAEPDDSGRDDRSKSKPRHWGGVRTPILLVIPLMVWTLSGGQTRFRLWRHGD